MSAMEDLSMAAGQNLTLQTFDNSNVTFTAGDLDYFNTYSLQICIGYAAQLGASLMLLIVMALLTNSERRKTLMFGLNTTALTFNFIRLLLLCLYYTSPWSEVYVVFAGAYDLVPQSAYATSVAAIVFNILALICIEICLVLQTQVVLITLPKLYRHGVLLTSVLVATMTVSFNIVFSVYNIRAIMLLLPDSDFDHLTDMANIVVTVSICWFSAIFTAKLGHAILQRRKMGLTAFGPMDVLFIIGGQTMIVPAIFSIASYASNIPSFYSNVLTATAIFMPLSSLWGSAVLDGRRSRAGQSPRNGSNTIGGYGGPSASRGSAKLITSKFRAGLLGQKRRVSSYSSTATSSTATSSPTLSNKSPVDARQQQVMVDLEKQGI